MDLSKLPKLSHTTPSPADQASPQDPPSAQPVPTAVPADTGVGVGADVWISAIVGIVLMLMGKAFAAWAFTTLAGGAYNTGMIWADGKPVGYWELGGGVAWTESGMFLLGLAFVIEAIALLVTVSRVGLRRPLIAFAFVFTVSATIYNVIAAGVLFSMGITPLLTILGIGLGGYIAASQYRLFRAADRSAAG